MTDKKFSFVNVILSVICVVFVAEAAAPAAAIGNAQFFWWRFLIPTFLLPYGMVVAELGTTYDSKGGRTRRAFGDKWASRVVWCYWVNYPLWVASCATLFPSMLGVVFGVRFGLPLTIAIELAFVWTVVLLSFSKVSDSDWILSGGAVLKVLIAVVVGALGIECALSNGFATDMSPATFLPDLTDADSLSNLSVILFNFMGFAVICTFASAMKNPSRDIPKAITMGGIAIAAIYLFAGFGIGAAIPAHEIDADMGMIVALHTMVGDSPLFKIVSVTFLVTLFSNMASWFYGVNIVADHAARQGNMPAFFALEAKEGLPTGAALIDAFVATGLLLLQLVPVDFVRNQVFWMLFSMNVVFLLLAYIPMFSALPKLRGKDPDRRRLFRVPLDGIALKVMLAVPCIEIVLSIVASIVPLSGSEVATKGPMLVGTLLILVVGEVQQFMLHRAHGLR